MPSPAWQRWPQALDVGHRFRGEDGFRHIWSSSAHQLGCSSSVSRYAHVRVVLGSWAPESPPGGTQAGRNTTTSTGPSHQRKTPPVRCCHRQPSLAAPHQGCDNTDPCLKDRPSVGGTPRPQLLSSQPRPAAPACPPALSVPVGRLKWGAVWRPKDWPVSRGTFCCS